MLQFYKFNPKIKAADLKILINTQDLSLHKIQKLHNLNSLIHSEMPLIPEACIKQSIIFHDKKLFIFCPKGHFYFVKYGVNPAECVYIITDN